MLPDIVSSKDLAATLGLTMRRIQQLGKEGVFEQSGHGKYALKDNVQAYIRWKVKSELARREDGPADERFKQERARKLKLENDHRELMLVETESAVAALDVTVGTLITELAGVPAQVTDDLTERRAIEHAIDTVLKSLSGRFEKASEYLAQGRDPYEALEKDERTAMG